MFNKKPQVSGYRYQIVEDPDNAEFPKHPDKLSKYPSWTDRMTGKMPTFYFYTAIAGFGLTYIIVGVSALLMHYEAENYMQWLGIVGLILGYGCGRFVLEPLFTIPFSQGTHEQQLDAVRRMNDHLQEEQDLIEMLREQDEAAKEEPDFDRSVFEDDEPEGSQEEQETEESSQESEDK